MTFKPSRDFAYMIMKTYDPVCEKEDFINCLLNMKPFFNTVFIS